jgi:hypothetical protein
MRAWVAARKLQQQQQQQQLKGVSSATQQARLLQPAKSIAKISHRGSSSKVSCINPSQLAAKRLQVRAARPAAATAAGIVPAPDTPTLQHRGQLEQQQQ